MSQENVEIVRRFYEHFNRETGVPVLRALDPEIVWYQPRGSPEDGAPIAGTKASVARLWR